MKLPTSIKFEDTLSNIVNRTIHYVFSKHDMYVTSGKQKIYIVAKGYTLAEFKVISIRKMAVNRLSKPCSLFKCTLRVFNEEHDFILTTTYLEDEVALETNLDTRQWFKDTVTRLKQDFKDYYSI